MIVRTAREWRERGGGERERLCNTKRFLAFRLPLDDYRLSMPTRQHLRELLAMIVQIIRVLTSEKFRNFALISFGLRDF